MHILNLHRITVTNEGHDPGIAIMRTQNLSKFYRFLAIKII